MEVGSPQIPAGNPTHGTQVGAASLRLTPTGLSPSMASHSRELRLRRVGMHIGAHFQLHIPLPFRRGVRFELCRFHSPLLTASRLISFPAPTKMFQFGAFPLPQPKLTGAPLKEAGIPIRASSVLRLPAPTRGFSQLGTPFFGALSRAIHQVA